MAFLCAMVYAVADYNRITMGPESELQVVLLPNHPQVISAPPYELVEVLIPVKDLTPGENYWIRASYPGSSSSDIVMKRKNIDY
jgi:hypothetical protein